MEFNMPAWVQQITVFGVMLVTVVIGIWKYIKTQTDTVHKKEPQQETIVTAASFVDTKLIRELIDTLREHEEEMGRQSQRITRSQGELRESMIELIEGLHVNTNSLLNIVRFLNKRDTEIK
jgi:Tfp pilus assembly protein PilO